MPNGQKKVLRKAKDKILHIKRDLDETTGNPKAPGRFVEIVNEAKKKLIEAATLLSDAATLHVHGREGSDD